ncbi:hypothetical protein AK812_SmicGene2430 [Symbiodinium microadriaticum]|uniref:Uncharacterized protein n=1 Tax=Symbiodinium microadriaticum TaxID=2951 RepID=A0A1Q9F1R7_SYMMI|nr:hypothetical protein AK812_SmicGene2430 [Symbiodinium microadriaticum]
MLQSRMKVGPECQRRGREDRLQLEKARRNYNGDYRSPSRCPEDKIRRVILTIIIIIIIINIIIKASNSNNNITIIVTITIIIGITIISNNINLINIIT